MTEQLLPVVLNEIKDTAFSFLFSLDNRQNPTDFTRDCPLSFGKTILMVQRLIKRSTSIELSQCFDEFGMDSSLTGEAFRKARKKIKFTAFFSLFYLTSKQGGSFKKLKTINGMRVVAIDGSTLRLKANKSLKEEFGKSSTNAGDVLARMSLAVDVLNGIVIDGDIGSFRIGERRMAMSHIKKGEDENRLYLFDRGYWSPTNVAKILDYNQKILMRIPSNSIPFISDSEQNSGIYSFSYKNKTYTLRYYKFMLNSGEMEYLITNLSNKEAKDQELKELYHLRWGIETKYNHLKNTLDLKNLSGTDALILKQDFFATLTIANLIAFAIIDAEEESKERNRRYIYKPNATYSAAILRQYFIRAVTSDDPEKLTAILDKIHRSILKNLIPIRPDRSFNRKTKLTKPMLSPSQKGAF